jgi:hypothetical protein
MDSMKFECCAYIKGEVWEEFKRSLSRVPTLNHDFNAQVFTGGRSTAEKCGRADAVAELKASDMLVSMEDIFST